MMIPLFMISFLLGATLPFTTFARELEPNIAKFSEKLKERNMQKKSTGNAGLGDLGEMLDSEIRGGAGMRQYDGVIACMACERAAERVMAATEGKDLSNSRVVKEVVRHMCDDEEESSNLKNICAQSLVAAPTNELKKLKVDFENMLSTRGASVRQEYPPLPGTKAADAAPHEPLAYKDICLPVCSMKRGMREKMMEYERKLRSGNRHTTFAGILQESLDLVLQKPMESLAFVLIVVFLGVSLQLRIWARYKKEVQREKLVREANFEENLKKRK